MTRVACQLVPALSALLLASGCYLFHGAPADPGPRRDAGTLPPPPIDATVPPPVVDAGPTPDAGPIPPSCTVAPVDVACTDTHNAAIPVGVPYDLPVYLAGVDACWCGEHIECRAAIAPDGVIELSTWTCADLLCDGCFSHVAGSCALPPLPEGVHHVRMNGRDVFDLTVSDGAFGIEPIHQCRSHPVDFFGCGWRWAPEPSDVDQICFANEATAGEPIPIAVTDFCHPCGYSVGSCQVTRTVDTIHVTPTVLPPACPIDCGMECEHRESECFIPPLEPGEYTVTLDGMPGSAPLLVLPPGGIGRPGNSCLSRPEDP